MADKNKAEFVNRKMNEALEKVGTAINPININDMPFVAAALKNYTRMLEQKMAEIEKIKPGTYTAYVYIDELMTIGTKAFDMDSEEDRREYVRHLMEGNLKND